MKHTNYVFPIQCLLALTLATVLYSAIENSNSEHFSGEPLKVEDMSKISGGSVEVESFPLPTHFSGLANDNYRMQFDIRHQDATLPSDLWIQVDYDNVKRGLFIVPTQYDSSTGYYRGAVDMRTSWPVGTDYVAELSLDYCDSSVCNNNTTLASGVSLPTVSFPQAISVRGVWFHNLESQDEATTLTLQEARDMVDNVNALSYPSHGPTLDAVMHQCSASPHRTQFRFMGLRTYDQAADSAINLNFNRNSNTFNDVWVDEGFVEQANEVDPNGEFLHVFMVRQIRSFWNSSNSFVAFSDGIANRGADSNIVILKDGMIEFNRVSVLAHEFGHAVAGFGHMDDTIANGGGNNPALCDGQLGVSARNLMCGTKWAGRIFNPTHSQQVETTDNSDVRNQCQAMFENGAGIPNLIDMH